MVTRAQCIEAGSGFGTTEFHYIGRHDCNRTIGPRGGVTESIVRARSSGRCQTWKTRPNEFRLPVKHGMYESSEITQDNASDWHLASECPLLASVKVQS